MVFTSAKGSLSRPSYFVEKFFFTKTVLVQIIFNLNQCHMRNAQVGHYLEGDMKIFMDKEARIY